MNILEVSNLVIFLGRWCTNPCLKVLGNTVKLYKNPLLHVQCRMIWSRISSFGSVLKSDFRLVVEIWLLACAGESRMNTLDWFKFRSIYAIVWYCLTIYSELDWDFYGRGFEIALLRTRCGLWTETKKVWVPPTVKEIDNKNLQKLKIGGHWKRLK